jgi:hypothetical protein
VFAGTVPAMSRARRPQRRRRHHGQRPERSGGPGRRENLRAQRPRGGPLCCRPGKFYRRTGWRRRRRALGLRETCQGRACGNRDRGPGGISQRHLNPALRMALVDVGLGVNRRAKSSRSRSPRVFLSQEQRHRRGRTRNPGVTMGARAERCARGGQGRCAPPPAVPRAPLTAPARCALLRLGSDGGMGGFSVQQRDRS